MAKANNNNDWYILGGVIIVLLILFFGRHYIPFYSTSEVLEKEKINIEILCSFSQNPYDDNSPKNAIKCKFRNYGGDGEQCFSVKELKIVNDIEELLDENLLCSGILSKEDYESDYKYIYNSESWKDYNSFRKDLTSWACAESDTIECVSDSDGSKIEYIIETSISV